MRDRDDLFDGLFAWSARSIELAERGESRQVSALLVSGGFFNETLARMLFPGRSPIGARLHGSEVVGVVADAVYRSAREGAPPTVYSIGRMTVGTLSVRPVPGAPATPSRIVEAILQIDPDVVVRTTPLSAHARMTLATERVTAMLAGFFGLLALVLAAVGTYGVMAYTVSRRRTELAIRKALGATASMLMTHVVGRGLKLVVGGVVLGATVSFWVGTLLSPMLYGVGPSDLPTLAGATMVLMAVALVAIWLPSRRAAHLNPAILLRQD